MTDSPAHADDFYDLNERSVQNYNPDTLLA